MAQFLILQSIAGKDRVSYNTSKITFLFFSSCQKDNLHQSPHWNPHRFHPVPNLPILLCSFLTSTHQSGLRAGPGQTLKERAGSDTFFFSLLSASAPSQGSFQGSRNKAERKQAPKLPLEAAPQYYA